MERVRKFSPGTNTHAKIENEIIRLCEERYRKRRS